MTVVVVVHGRTIKALYFIVSPLPHFTDFQFATNIYTQSACGRAEGVQLVSFGVCGGREGEREEEEENEGVLHRP